MDRIKGRFAKGHKVNLGRKFPNGKGKYQIHKENPTWFKKGQCSGFSGKKFNIESRKKMSLSQRRRFKNDISWNKGLKLPQFSKENHWNWQGGKVNQKKNCIDCGEKIGRFSTRCFSCRIEFSKGQNAAHFQNAKIEAKCDNCKRIITIYKYTLKRNKRHFCSKKCNNKYYSGYNAVRWKGGLPKCKDCGKEIWYINKRCRICDNKFHSGNNHWAWKGGISNNPYSFDFNDRLKEEINKRDNYICQICKITEEEHLIVYGQPLCIHHIDYNKLNSKENNLIALCHSCHTRTNFNRDYWIIYFEKSEVKNAIFP